MPKGYWIAHVTVTDPTDYERYRSMNGAAFAKYGGRFLVRGGTHVVANGNANDRQVVIEFPSYQAALDCYHSPEYQAALAVFKTAALSDHVIAEGYDG